MGLLDSVGMQKLWAKIKAHVQPYIKDASLEGNVLTFTKGTGESTDITLPSSSTNRVTLNTTGSGNAVTSITQAGNALTITKGETFATNEDVEAIENRVADLESNSSSGGNTSSGDSSIIDLGAQENHKDAQQAMVDYVSEITDGQGHLLFKYYCTCYGNACFAIVDYYHNQEDGWFSCSGTVYDSMRSFREFDYTSDDGFTLDGCWLPIASFAEDFSGALETENKEVIGAINETYSIALNGYKPNCYAFMPSEDENSWMIIRDYDDSRTEALIPSFTSGKPVTSIGEEAFYNCYSLINVAIPDSITSIESHAFYSCNSLPYVNIPNSVTSIGEWAFGWCTNLTSVVIPDSVTSIGNNAFYNCPNLTIYCEAPSKPDGWDDNWNESNCPVVWGFANNFVDVNKKLAEIGTGGSGGAGLSMPRIRLSNWEYITPAVMINRYPPAFEGKIKFSVCVQDGTVQEGDELQICALRKTFGKYKLRQFSERVITAEDIENLEKQPFLQVTTGVKDFFRTDSAMEWNKKPKYIRIRRPILGKSRNGEWVEVNALFSNVVPVHIGLRYT